MARLSETQIVFPHSEISRRVVELAHDISLDYQGCHPVLLGVLKGSFVFLADLIRHLGLEVKIDFVRLSSYSGQVSSGKVSLLYRPQIALKGEDIIVVEDIIDSGLTAATLTRYLRENNPASIRLCALVDKPWHRSTSVVIDYLGFTAPDRFLVGYGLDYNEDYRHLPDIYALAEDNNGKL